MIAELQYLYLRNPFGYVNRFNKSRYVSIKFFIINETKKGGKLVFFMEIKRKEYDGVQIKAEVFMTKQSVALYKWGRVCFDIVNSEHKGKPVNEGNKEYIKAGFYKKSENNCW